MPNDQVAFTNLTVLIAEDRSFMIELVRGVLRQNGCREVLVAENGVKAIDKFEEGMVDLLICDINMEPLNGLQLLAAIRSGLTDAPVDLPIIMLTGHTEDPMIEASQILKANGFLGKPVSAMDLTTEIARVLTSNDPFEAPPVDKEAALQAIEAARVQLREEERAMGLDVSGDGETDAASEAQAEAAEQGWIDVNDVQIGHVLAEDVVSGKGQKLLSAGTALDNKQVELLQRDAGKLGVSTVRVRS